MATGRTGRVLKRYGLKGPYAGSDVVLCGHLFRAGVAEVVATEAEHVSLARVFWYYQAEEIVDDGKRDVQTDQAGDVGGEVRPEGEGSSSGEAAGGDAGANGTAKAGDTGRGLVSGGDGQTESVGLLRMALLGLDPSMDAHWTPAGKPSLKAIEASYGKPVTRAQVEAALPGLNRKGML